ncbi:MAG: hypothetical protein RIM72_06300 [Alphaproteobacteria bacterium]
MRIASKFLKVVTLSLGLPLCAVSAQAALIDFDELPHQAQFGSLTVGGFTVTHNGPDAHFATTNAERFGDGPDSGSRYLSAMGGSFTISLNAPGTFSLASFSAGEGFFLFTPGLYWAQTILITGTRADSTTVTQSVTLDGINDGAGGSADFETFSGATVTGLSSLVSLAFAGQGGPIGFNGFSLDDIQLALREPALAVTPVPTPLILLATGLGLFGLVGRKFRRHRRT